MRIDLKNYRVRLWHIGFFVLLLSIVALHNADAFTLKVVDNEGKHVNNFRWLVEEDTTQTVVPGVFDPTSISLSIHRSYSPVVKTGHSDTATVDIPVNKKKKYYVSVLPDMKKGRSISGAKVDVGQDVVKVTVERLPLPTAQISVLIFEDLTPLNGTPDLPLEHGLPGFALKVFDQLGEVNVDAFGNPLGTTYQQNPDGTFVLDADGNPVVDVVGHGYDTGPDGRALIKYLPEGKYGVRAVPRDGQPWVQTWTIEGTPGIDTWIKPAEAPQLLEFGAFFPHVFIGFTRPFDNISGTGTGEIRGRAVNVHSPRPPQITVSNGLPLPECYVGLNDLSLPNTDALYMQPCNADSTFDIVGVPDGTYQIVIFDRPLDAIITFATAIVDSTVNGGLTDMGDVAVNRWFGTYEGSVFNDLNQDGVRQCYSPACDGSDPRDEVGIANQILNLRIRDGSINSATITDSVGEFTFSEVFPFFKWLVAEVDYSRYKPTGAFIAVDNGGELPTGSPDPLIAGLAARGINPQLQPDNSNLPYRIESGPFPVLLEGMILYADQTQIIDWGKVEYPAGENGGIAGIVHYATTRAENEAVNASGEPWEPGVPRVQVNLYADFNKDGKIDDVTHNGTIQRADVDNYPFGNFPGPEDIDWNGNGRFDAGDAINVVHTDSWDDLMPTGCVNPAPQTVNGVPIMDCAETLRTWNQVRPAVFDGGYIFTSYFPGGMTKGAPEVKGLPTGTYIVEVVPPKGYLIQKEEDKNVEVGDSYVPFLTPPPCVGHPHTVPQFLTLDHATPAPHAGETIPLCDRRQVDLAPGQNAAVDFSIFTMVPKAGRFVGRVTNDLFNTFGLGNPNFAEKLSPPWIPISVKDYQGIEISRVYSDEYGQYEMLIPSTYTINPPIPTGVSPHMVQVCLNDPGPVPNPENPKVFITDPFYNPSYAGVCLTFDSWPGKITYVDTPLLPIAAFTASDFNLDCEFPDGTPLIYTVSGPLGGPHITATGQKITIQAVGKLAVPNPAFDPTDPDSPATVIRDYGFGSSGTVTVNGVPLTNVNWAVDGLTIKGTVPAGTTTGDVVVTRDDNGKSSILNVTLNIGTAQPVVRVQPGASVQTAINNAAPNSIVLIPPGVYKENLIMWKPLTLEGWGAWSTRIDATVFDSSSTAAWLSYINDLVTTQQVTLVPKQRTDFLLEQQAGITVLGADNGVATLFGASPRARIDSLTITGAGLGGGIFVNGYAHYLEISNNRILSNQGSFGGGIRTGWPLLVNTDNSGNPIPQCGTGAYCSAKNDNISIRNNHILKNGGNDAGGGIALLNGTDNYMVTRNFICGNLNPVHGAGIGHSGLSRDGVIANNWVLLNETANGTPGDGKGAGIFIGGEPVPAGVIPAPVVTTTLTDGTGSVTINANVIQGNSAIDDGGGISLSQVNGEDVLASADPTTWYTVNIFNNMIVNNMSSLAGGGIAMVDAARVNILQNTIADNDSTAVNAAAFAAGPAAVSTPQGAGVISRVHNQILAAASGQEFSDPILYNNIIWHNRSFSYDPNINCGDPLFGCLGGLLPDPGAPVYADLQVYNPGVASQLSPMFSVLSDTTGYDVSNTMNDPLFYASYFNVYQTAATAGEGGNAVSVIFSPLTLTGNYHIQALSSARDQGAVSVPVSNAALAADIDGQVRPESSTSIPDSGADEFYLIPVNLEVATTGTGTGTVDVSPPGISCGVGCNVYNTGQTVVLTATPAAGSYFAGWTGGGCTGVGTCTVTMNKNRNVIAKFHLIPTGGGQFSISGSVTRLQNKTGFVMPDSGVTMKLKGAATATTTTDSNGNYFFPGLASGDYEVKPVNTGFTYTPAKTSVTVTGTDVTNIDFRKN